MLLVAIYGVKFYLFLRILKTSEIGFRSVFLFFHDSFSENKLYTNHKNELSSIKKNYNYSKGNEVIAIDKTLVTYGDKKAKESRTWQ
jgi:hypothetical protein